eukprot:TRINITY_DN7243_c0_g3_i7.p2 TRINITY_DN7243_c0_g3~~TRINITY_DN7243_c0_g3_i7.p2  ORF type:complete len:120 (-),score=31.76 TRINITY_DN7243_c0_g3_i7:72-431(-)
MGADMAYMGTRFISIEENNAPMEYKQMIVSSALRDIIYTSEISGIPANFLIPSLVKAGLDPNNLPKKGHVDMGEELSDSKAWKDIWSAGHGCGAIHEILPMKEMIQKLVWEYNQAKKKT